MLAKTDDRHAKLVTGFFLRWVKKSHQALVQLNDLDIAESGTIDLPVTGCPAHSTYQIEERYSSSERIRLETKTGRKHQVRVHCAQGLGAPIVGDVLYGLDETDSKGGRFCLHSLSLHIPGLL